MKNILNYESQIYSVKTNDFEGPLDLLCHLIDKNKMNICDIDISNITDQYIQYLNAMEELDLEIASEFVIMASTLLYLKSNRWSYGNCDEQYKRNDRCKYNNRRSNTSTK